MENSESKGREGPHKIAGHSVEIKKLKDHEELRIDGVRTNFFATADGYNLNAAAYDRPHKSLLDAVKAFLEPRKRITERK